MKNGGYTKWLMETLTSMSYTTLFTMWLVLAAMFAAFYFALAVFAPEHGPILLQEDPTILAKLFDSIYYSVITATSTGYGDIVPQGFSKVLASLQSIIAMMVFAMFVTKLVSFRQEQALKEVHRLTFEDVFHNIREGLYIIRKDCDQIIVDARDGHLTEERWKDLTVMYQMSQSILKEIPDFYAAKETDAGFYTIDSTREKLLHESVHRTLHRINTMLDALSENNITWAEHTESFRELQRLVITVDEVAPIWQSDSPYREAFGDILKANAIIHDRLKEITK